MRKEIRRAINGIHAIAVLTMSVMVMWAATCLCVVEKGEESTEFYRRIGNAFMENRQYDKALAMFEKARSIDGESVPEGRIAAAHRGFADMRLDKGDYRGAVEHYENAKKLDPTAVGLLPKLGEAYRKLGSRLMEDGDISRVISITGKALAIFPDSVEALRLRGEALIKKGDFEGALEQFTRIVKIEPKDAEARMRVGLIDEKLGKGKQAIEVYNSIIESNPKFVQAYVALGEYYERRRNFDKAVEVYRKGIEKAPSSASLHGNLAWAYISDGNYLDAYNECQTALGLDPGNAYVHNYLGLILMHINRLS
ncbi:MAG: tetratricopeptide repeat protein, partial [bacterium]